MPTVLISYCLLLLLLLLLYCCCCFAIATKKLLLLINYCEQELFLGVAELTTQLLRLASILYLPLCQINKLGNTTLEDRCDPLYLWVINGGCLRCLDGSLYRDGGLLVGGLGGDDGHRAILLHRRRGGGFLGGLQKVMGQWRWLRE